MYAVGEWKQTLMIRKKEKEKELNYEKTFDKYDTCHKYAFSVPDRLWQYKS